MIVNADSDTGHRRALAELAAGNRVVVTALRASALVRILPGHDSRTVLAVAADFADPRQRERLFKRAAERLGPVDRVIDGRTGRPLTPGGRHALVIAS